MKIAGVILKILAALAAVAGVVYVVAAYGDKIVAWAKKLLGISEECCCGCDCEDCDCECDCADCECECDCCEPCDEETAEEDFETEGE